MLLILTSTALSGIYSAALDRYATVGDASGMDNRPLADAFERR